MKNKMKFLPLLLLYIFFILILSTDILVPDEPRYVMYADNLTHGHYSPRDNVSLRCGPGYPLFLAPFILFNLPWIAAKLFNALFLLFGIIYLYKTLRFYISERSALGFSYLFGVYPPFFKYFHVLLTEMLAVFLACGFMYHFCNLFKLRNENKRSWPQLVIASFYLGYLALTKVLYGYVILAVLLLFLVLYLLKRIDIFKRTLLVCICAFIFCLPYLFYTYSITGKVFYWASLGGESLYWMSSPYPSDLGSFFNYRNVREIPELYKNRGKFIEEVYKLPVMQRDEIMKKRAVSNMTHYPIQYMKNLMANAGRLWFSYPFPYIHQKLSTFFWLTPNIFILVPLVLSIFPAYLGRRLIPYEIYGLLLFTLIAFAGQIFAPASPRYLFPLIPFFALWISFISIRVMKIEIRR